MTEDELYAMWDRLAVPDRDSDWEGHRTARDGRRIDWDYWVTGDRGAVCYWCPRAATGLVLTDAAGRRCVSSVAVCPRHRPEWWNSRQWESLQDSFEPGAVHLRPPGVRVN